MPDFTRDVCRAIENARTVAMPFVHLEFEGVFPHDVYSEMLRDMPRSQNYRRLSGRSKETDRDGKPTRVKMELLPEYIAHLPRDRRAVWKAVSETLCSNELQRAFRRKLAEPLARRFGPEFEKMRFYPVPLLTRDTLGYAIPPHTDTSWKGITVQFYLPPDDSNTHIGTVFLEQRPDGTWDRVSKMRFAPNSGYAFAVDRHTWHSVDEVGPEVKSRDSILLTYVVDAGGFRVLRNRLHRGANMLLNEWRHWTRR